MNNDNLVIKPKRPKGEDGYKVFSIRVNEDTVSKIEEMVNKTGRSRNEIIGLLLDFAMERCIIEE